MQDHQKEYDPFSIPANVDIAIKHQVCENYIKKATRCGTPIDKSELCPCCGREIEQDLKNITVSNIDLAFLGQGIPLYFQFLQQMIAMILFVLLVMGIYSIITNSLGDNCIDSDSPILLKYQQGFCQENCPQTNATDFQKMVSILGTNSNNCDAICNQYSDICTKVSSTKISLSNKQLEDDYKEIQAILVLICIICFKGFMLIFKRHQKLTSDECDRGLTSASDFTVMLTRLPPNQYSEAELRDSLMSFCKAINQIQEFEIAKITIAYDIYDYIENIRTKTQLEKQYQLNEVHFKVNNKYPEKVTDATQKEAIQEIERLEEQLEKIETNIQQKQFTQTTQVAFVTLQTKLQLEALIDYTKLSYWEIVWVMIIGVFGKTYTRGFYFKERLITIKRAPEPDDVFWENCGYNLDYKIKWRTLSWIITLFLLIVSFFILFGLDYVQNTYLGSKNINYVLLTIISLVISFIISFINGVIYFSITQLGLKEKHYTKTHYDESVATKLIYVQFVNSGLLILATNILVQGLSTASFDQDIGLQRLAFSRPGGVASDAFIITLINSLVTSFLSYFDVFYLIKINSQKKLKNSKSNMITQTEANIMFEGSKVTLYDNYTYACKTIWITFLFAPLVPICLLFCVFGLLLYYWVQKYLLLRRRARPPLQSNLLNREMLSLIDLSPIFLAVGQLWVDYVFDSNGTTKIINFISIGIAGLELFIPFDRIAKKFITWPDDPNDTVRYSEKWHELPTDYDRINPVTRQQAVINYMKFKKQLESHQDNNKTTHDQIDSTGTLIAMREYAQIGGEQRFSSSKLAFKLKVINDLKLKSAFKAGVHALNQHNQNKDQQQHQYQNSAIPNQEEQIKLIEQQKYSEQIQKMQQHINQPLDQYNQVQLHIESNNTNLQPNPYYDHPQPNSQYPQQYPNSQYSQQYYPQPQYQQPQPQYQQTQQQYQQPQYQQYQQQQVPNQQPSYPLQQQYPEQPYYAQQQYYQQNPYQK